MVENCRIWKSAGVPATRVTGTGFAGVRNLKPVPQPQQNPSIYPGVFPTCANPYPHHLNMSRPQQQ